MIIGCYDTTSQGATNEFIKRLIINIIITIIIIFEFICNDLIGVHVKEERLHNPYGFVYDTLYKVRTKEN